MRKRRGRMRRKLIEDNLVTTRMLASHNSVTARQFVRDAQKKRKNAQKANWRTKEYTVNRKNTVRSSEAYSSEFGVQRFKGMHAKQNVKCELWTASSVFGVWCSEFGVQRFEEKRKSESPKCEVWNASWKFGVQRKDSSKVWRDASKHSKPKT